MDLRGDKRNGVRPPESLRVIGRPLSEYPTTRLPLRASLWIKTVGSVLAAVRMWAGLRSHAAEARPVPAVGDRARPYGRESPNVTETRGRPGTRRPIENRKCPGAFPGSGLAKVQ